MQFKDFLNENITIDLTPIKKIIKKMQSLTGLDLNEDDILNVLNKNFYDYFIRFRYSKSISSNPLYSEGSISSAETDIDYLFITVNIYKNTIRKSFDSIEDYEIFGLALLKVINHELIHRQQLSRMNKSYKITYKNPDSTNIKEYLGNKLEIVAHAKNIIWDMIYSDHSLDAIKELIKNPYKYTSESENLKIYLKTFEKNSDVLKLLFKNIYLFLDEMLDKMKKVK